MAKARLPESRKHRKTLIVCGPCHHSIHTGAPSAWHLAARVSQYQVEMQALVYVVEEWKSRRKNKNMDSCQDAQQQDDLLFV